MIGKTISHYQVREESGAGLAWVFIGIGAAMGIARLVMLVIPLCEVPR